MKIKIDYKLDNWNDTIKHNRTNKYLGAKRKRKEMDIIRYFLLNVPKIKKYPIKLNCKSLKSVLDQMQLSGILENDNINHINEINHKAVKDNEEYLEIEVIENE